MDENKKSCDLCGLAVEVEGFELKTLEGDKRFCCEGCKGIYQMLHEAQVLQEEADDSKSTTS
ncbi:heavy metal translocating P-type ATPase metal-binding domain-containing protein [Methylomonas montana]|uniref:heavy metal translocating P-type ATPase metal-binding domain-containing protein n=1 Tax=Methylomonas montana TaxID=3058963 RepID=UPI00265B0EC9|nr:heavy metal translocating P-type ATPase metal-binding domain-containing protein [Methylomonas montana]WKJ89295.1 heavy metal translocating P-type ATPase metal-binding domain-containing protein [Methylomonas montana]